jgi:hypothetical protein
MAKISMSLLRKEQETFKTQNEYQHFGPYMVNKYAINDLNLLKELDHNMAMLRLIKDHVQEDNNFK